MTHPRTKRRLVSLCGVALALLAIPAAAQGPAAGGAPAVAPSPAVGSSPPATSPTGTPGGGHPTPTASAPPTPGAAAPIGATPDALPDPHRSLQPLELLSGRPFDSEAHVRQADLARAGQVPHLETTSRAEAGMTPGAIGVIVRDAQGRPVPGQLVRLKIRRENIEQGNTDSELSTVSNEQGFAGFTGQLTESQFNYEVVAESGQGLFSSGSFRLDRDRGQVVALFIFPTTPDITQAFVFTRSLFVLEPRDDVFQIQVLYRFQNTNRIAWVPSDLAIPLPSGASAFQPGNTTGNLRMLAEDGRVEITGTLGPGQHELSFAYQLPNPGDASVGLELPIPPHLVEAKVFLEASKTMTLAVSGLEASSETRGRDGRRSLFAGRDFLRSDAAVPTTLKATVGGLPTHGLGALVAALIAGTLAAFGIAVAASKGDGEGAKLDGPDHQQARKLLLDELLLVERAFRNEKIGPKTYERTRRTLLDALARLDLSLGGS